ncbi:MAG TPA: aminoacyl-tRNA hydrolase [Candidatus Moranbacteria bacterium]|nr:aminoacyl-tRNA hydrolase [Candidatus Moranbacteria bacterium]HAT74963.1 aminoacyl-tRNA hydrolase [Candidatus Moranbacteria bacterium]
MKLIVGLGNPGEKYKNTRHNLGFLFLDKLREKWSFPVFKLHKKFNAELSQGEIDDKKIILAKPQTFMNLSGETAKKLLDFYKLSANDLLVIHDDLDITCGKYKLATDSSSAGHNGVQNIIDKLNTKKFARLRIGIGPEKEPADFPQPEAGDFVLEKITKEELRKISEIEKEVLEKTEGTA